MNFSPLVFRDNDIRGIFGKDFNLDFCKELSYGLALLIKEKGIANPKILIGHDSRLNSPSLAKNLSEELEALNVSTCNTGLAPSPLCYFLLHHYKLTATVVVTASHNPVGYNGFKIVFHEEFKEFNPITKIKDFILKEKVPIETKKACSFHIDPVSPYLSFLKEEFCLKPCSFVVDTGNGALGPLAKRVFSELGLKPHFLFCEPDGRFPNRSPDSSSKKSLKPLLDKVLETKALFGFGFDGDGDRITLIDQSGRFIYGDELGFLFFNSLLKKSKRPFLGDIKCADWFFDSAKKLGGEIHKTPSGHHSIREIIVQKKAQLAVDFSGHIFFNDRKNRGFDDALYASLRLLELVSKNPLSSLLPPQNPYQTEEVRKVMKTDEIKNSLDKIKNHLEQKKEPYDSQDGFRVSRSKGSWFLFRASKTQNAFIYRLGAKTHEDLKNLQEEFSQVLGFKI